MKICIIGGVAGGANVATRARRLSESAEIILFEKGPYVSFANCGLPYHIGGEIKQREKLLVQTPESLLARYRLDVRVLHEVVEIEPLAKRIRVQNILDGSEYIEHYDELVFSPGALPIRPPLPGLDKPGVFCLRDMLDMDNILAWITEKSPKRVVVIGGGFIGLEVIEQMAHRGMQTTLVEAAQQVLPPLDPEMAAYLRDELLEHGIHVSLGSPVVNIEDDAQALVGCVTTERGDRFPADLVLLAIGVRPNTELAKHAGVDLGPSGGITVNEYLQTSIEHIWALGDVAEIPHRILGSKGLIPLAGPANRQGRLLADNMLLPEKKAYIGAMGTAIARVFSLTAACTGVNEKTLRKLELPCESVFLHPKSHAGYYPGAQTLAVKLLFDPHTERLLGAQAVGAEGVDKRIDVIATAIAGKMTVSDLLDLELCYAPPFGSAKDPVNLAGMLATNVTQGLVSIQHPAYFDAEHYEGIILDVRDDDERAQGAIPGSLHIPLHELRSRLSEIPHGKEITAYCASGQRSYIACRILTQHGYLCKNLSGAYRSWSKGQHHSSSS